MPGAFPLLARALDRTRRTPRNAVRSESALIGLRGGAQTDRAIVAALKKSSGNTRAVLVTALARRAGPGGELFAARRGRPDLIRRSPKRPCARSRKTATGKEVTPLLERLTRTQRRRGAL